MRKALIASLAVTAALIVVAAATGRSTTPTTRAAGAAIPGCAKDQLGLLDSAALTVGADNPAFPPWFGGAEKTKPWKVSDPYSGKGYESAVAYAVAKQLGFSKAQVKWTVTPFNNSFRPGKKSFDFYITQVSYNPQRAKAVDFSKAYYFVNQSIVGRKGKPIASVRSINGLKKYKLGAQVGTTSYDYIVNQIKPSSSPQGLRHERRRGPGAQERPDRRARRRPADRVLRHGGAGAGRQGRSASSPPRGRRSASGSSSRRAAS